MYQGPPSVLETGLNWSSLPAPAPTLLLKSRYPAGKTSEALSAGCCLSSRRALIAVTILALTAALVCAPWTARAIEDREVRLLRASSAWLSSSSASSSARRVCCEGIGMRAVFLFPAFLYQRMYSFVLLCHATQEAGRAPWKGGHLYRHPLPQCL